jgi:hypothetical protein
MQRQTDSIALDFTVLEKRMSEIRHMNERRRARVEREQFQIAKANEEYDRLGRLLRNARAHRNASLLPGSSKLSLKTSGVMSVWLAVQEAFEGTLVGDGRTTNQLCAVIRRAMPGIPESTIRSHLRRFKKKRALTKIGFQWFLEPPPREEAAMPTSQPSSAEGAQHP